MNLRQGVSAPDFVIAGAPKCGTTSIYETLRRHSQVFLPACKEPHFFAFEFKDGRGVERWQDYLRLFRPAKPGQLRGEASTGYLSSPDAISALLLRRPNVKIIACVRDPRELFVSFHNELLKHGVEEEPCPERAWQLQDERARGSALPRGCRVPRLLQYREICSIGAQIGRMYASVPAPQRLVVVFDDLKSAPQKVYKGIVNFLGIRDEGVENLVKRNEFARHRIKSMIAVQRACCRPPLKTFVVRLRPMFHDFGLRPLYWANQRSLTATARPVLAELFFKELTEYFEPDVHVLERLLGRELPMWLK